MPRKLRIAIDCRIENFRQGVGTAVMALAKALSDSVVADQEYTFIVRQDMLECVRAYVRGPVNLVGIKSPRFSNVKASLRALAPLRSLWRSLRSGVRHLPKSDGYVESGDFDLVHFPTQMAYVTELPSIYQPWDLQHLHYPQFFSKDEYQLRERLYRAFCERATFVCVQAEWTKQDLVQHYGIAPEKVTVIPWGSVFTAYQKPAAECAHSVVAKFGLPDEYFIYPAVTWPHKNHEVILRALQLLKRDRRLIPHACFTGALTEHRMVLEKLAAELGIANQLHFLGFVSTDELQSLFSSAKAMLFPSKFEGFGLPVLEAFHTGLPVLCSRSSTLPEVAQDAALYFDADSQMELAELMTRVLHEPSLRNELSRKGRSVLAQYSSDGMSTSFQRLYRQASASSSQFKAEPAAAII